MNQQTYPQNACSTPIVEYLPGGFKGTMWDIADGGIRDKSVGSRLWLRVRSRLLGRSLTRKLSCLLNGDA